jgi:hypothetical protein
MLGAPSFRSFIAEGWETTDLLPAKSKRENAGLNSHLPPFTKYAKDGAPIHFEHVKRGPPAE